MVSRAAELLQPQGDANGVAEGALGARCGTLVKTPIAEPKGFFSRRLDLSKTRVGKERTPLFGRQNPFLLRIPLWNHSTRCIIQRETCGKARRLGTGLEATAADLADRGPLVHVHRARDVA